MVREAPRGNERGEWFLRTSETFLEEKVVLRATSKKAGVDFYEVSEIINAQGAAAPWAQLIT